MLSFLKDHPFAVEAFFDRSVVLTFAVPRKEIEHLIPECLELDTFREEWAFIAVAMVQTKSLRPRKFPKLFGNDFFLIGYRIFVKYTTSQGKNLRGLYIIKSETDKRKMEFFGNIFTHYNYTTTDINVIAKDDLLEIYSGKSGFNVVIEESAKEPVGLPEGSPFTSWKEARRYAGPLPFTFTYDKVQGKVLIIEGVREDWKPVAVRVVSHDFAFLKAMCLSGIRLANAFVIRQIPYYWKKGKVEIWKPKEENSRVS